MQIDILKKKALDLRIKTFQAFIEKGEAHLGGAFSMMETLLSLYEVILKKNDKFILSKSHSSFPLCILLNEKGFNNKISTHLEIDEKNGIHCTTGSLGHGLPKKKKKRVIFLFYLVMASVKRELLGNHF